MTGFEAMGMVLDGLVAALLVATIVSAVVLNRKLTNLRGAKAEMEAMIGRLIDATEAARGSLASLRVHAQESGDRLQRTLDAARGATDELSFLLERADSVSRDLDKAVTTPPGRASTAPGTPLPMRAARQAGARPEKARRAPPSDQESALLKALQDVR